MYLSPVSFKSSYSDLINKPQLYQRKENPVPATGIKHNGAAKKSKHGLLKTVLLAAAAAAGLAYAAKKGKLDYKGDNQMVQKVAGYAKKAGLFVAEKAAKVKDIITTKFFKKAVDKDADELAKLNRIREIVGDGRDVATANKLRLEMAKEKLANAQKALAAATTDNAKLGIEKQIAKLEKFIQSAIKMGN